MKYTVKFKGYVLFKYVDGQIHLQLILYYQSIGKGQAKIFFFKIQPNKIADLFFFIGMVYTTASIRNPSFWKLFLKSTIRTNKISFFFFIIRFLPLLWLGFANRKRKCYALRQKLILCQVNLVLMINIHLK